MELEAEPGEENDNKEMETVPEQIPPVEEEEMPFRMSPMSPLGLKMREDLPELAEALERMQGTMKSWRC